MARPNDSAFEFQEYTDHIEYNPSLIVAPATSFLDTTEDRVGMGWRSTYS